MVKYSFMWEDSGLALLRSLECSCGNIIVNEDDEEYNV
jgi:hypothetical protein